MALTIEDGTVITGADSYITVAELEAYCLERLLYMPDDTEVGDQDEENKEAAILRAMSYIDSRNFKGVKTDRANPLIWPRDGVEDKDGYAVESDEIPTELTNALLRASYEEMYEPEILQPNVSRDDLVKREKIDVIETEYFEHRSPVTTQFTIIDEYLKGLVKSSSSADVVRT